ncbi:RNA polymerase sigma factor [Nakamurella lactea]|uniref:RNA polymerase sigma factor n=1 Tax=Nakamurella lactea TaxID=459515 RepID=UPI0003FC6B83|nr:DUF6596 domain-containing protein [Nakamurella lactea]
MSPRDPTTGIPPTVDDVNRAAAIARREHSARVMAVMLRSFRDPDLAEEATADAFEAALQSWPTSGIPAAPQAWLITAARRKALDRLRHDQVGRRMALRLSGDRPPETAPGADTGVERGPLADDELRLVVLCCDPRLPTTDQTALTLKWACGVSTKAIAAAHLVPVPTMAARLTRARLKIAAAGPDLDLPDEVIDRRLPVACRVIQLAYTLGHTAVAGDELRDEDLIGRSVHLARALQSQRPRDPEITGLLALILLSEARNPARQADGRQILLADADRRRWNATLVQEGLELTRRVMAEQGGPTGSRGPMVLQAAIAAEHCRAKRFADTDWDRIIALYGDLLTVLPSPTLALGRCVAWSYRYGPEPGLTDLQEVMADGRLDRYPYAHAAQAEMLQRTAQADAAVDAWRRAAECARSGSERSFFLARAAAVDRR